MHNLELVLDAQVARMVAIHPHSEKQSVHPIGLEIDLESPDQDPENSSILMPK